MKYIKRIAIFLIFALMIFAFFPNVMKQHAMYTNLKIVIFLTLLYLAISENIFKAFSHPQILFLFRAFLVITIQTMFLYALDFNIGWTDVSALGIVLIVICIGYRSSISLKMLQYLVLFFSTLSAMLGIYSMLYFVGSVTFDDYLYAIESKNQIGQIVASSGVALVILFFLDRSFYYYKVVLLIVITVLLFVLRCRSALLAYLLFCVLLYYRTHKVKNAILFSFLALVVFLLFSSYITYFFEEAFIGTRDIEDLNSLSAGRMSRNISGIDFYLDNPILGELNNPSFTTNVHNYLLKRLVAYGFFAIPYIVIYFYLLMFLSKKWLFSGTHNLNYVGFGVLFIPFFCSMLEPSAPFGPGLVQSIPFFFFGVSLQNNNNYIVFQNNDVDICHSPNI